MTIQQLNSFIFEFKQIIEQTTNLNERYELDFVILELKRIVICELTKKAMKTIQNSHYIFSDN